MYEEGIGVEKNIEEAKVWYEKSATKGNSLALQNLARLYMHGDPNYPLKDGKIKELCDQIEQRIKHESNSNLFDARGYNVIGECNINSEEAKENYMNALVIQKQVLGDDNMDVAITQIHLAVVNYKLGEKEEVKDNLLKALENKIKIEVEKAIAILEYNKKALEIAEAKLPSA